MNTVELELTNLLALGDPGERTQICEADLHRFPFHLEKGFSVELVMMRPDAVAGAAQHSHPVGDEMAFAGLGVIELAGQCRRAPAAQPVSHDEDLADVE